MEFPPGIDLGDLDLCGVEMSRPTTHVLTLDTDFETIWKKRFNRNNRRATLRAEDAGFDLSDGTEERDIQDFIALYRSVSEGWQYPLPPGVLRVLAQETKEHPKKVRFRTVRKSDVLAGGGFFLYHHTQVFALIVVFDREHRHSSPSRLMLKEEIRHALEQGCLEFNLGSSQGSSSLEEFKESYGAPKVERLRIVARNPFWQRVAKIRERR